MTFAKAKEIVTQGKNHPEYTPSVFMAAFRIVSNYWGAR